MKTIKEYMPVITSTDKVMAELGWDLNKQKDFTIEKIEGSELNGHVNGTYKGTYFVLGCSNIGVGKEEHKKYSCYVFVSAVWPEGDYGQQVNFKTTCVADAFKSLTERIENLI